MPNDEIVKPVAPLHSMTAGSAVVLLLAIASVLTIAGIQGGFITINTPLSASVTKSAFEFALLPHLVVIALLTTGFRRTGDMAAIAVACWIGGWSGVIAMLSLDPKIAAVPLLQVVMLSVALTDLLATRRASPVTVPARARLLGLLVPVVVGFIGYRMIDVPVHQESARRATLSPKRRAEELGYALEPSPLLPDSVRLKADDWADYSVLGRLMGMAGCIERFRGDSGGPYPRSLRELQAWSLRDTVSSVGCASKLTSSTEDTTLTFLGSSDGRVIRYTPPAGAVDPYRPGPFSVETEAIWSAAQSGRAGGRPGVRNYLLDTAGKFHVTDEHRRVSVHDRVLPVCDPPEVFREVAECGVVYPPRRRWGVLGLPFAQFSSVNEVTAGEQFSPMLQFNPVIALDSVARVTIDWGDAAPAALEEVPATSERSYGTHHDWNRTVSHVYRTPGRYQLELTITTRNGDSFSARQSLSVKPR